MMRAVVKHVFNENTLFKPGYKSTDQHALSIRLRIEMQGYESAKFKSLLGGSSTDDLLSETVEDYLMLRRPRLNTFPEE